MVKSYGSKVDRKSRYDIIAPIYDWLEFPMEKLAGEKWRKLFWSQVEGPEVLEVGVGTGKNIPYYPGELEVTGVDLSKKMLKGAEERADKRKDTEKTSLVQMDVQDLEFAKNSFDSTVATFVFCSVSDPVMGLREINRVTRPAGEVLLLEHVRPESWLLGNTFDFFNPVSVRLLGVNINRKTTENVQESGLEIKQVNNLTKGNIVKLITAKPSD